jgi:hypothetical protein
MKPVKIILASVVALGILATAVGPLVAEDDVRARRPDRGALRSDVDGGPAPQQKGGGPDGWGGRRWGAPPSEDEWKQIEAFAQEYSPRRLAALNALRDAGDPAYRAAQTFIVVRYRALQQMKEHDPDLYAERLKVLTLEDKVFGAVQDGHGKPDATPEQKEALRADVRELISINLREREQRLERLAKALDDERQKLADDQAREDELTDRKMARIAREGVKALQPDAMRRHDRGDRDDGPGRDRDPRPDENNGPPPGPPPGQ